MLDENIEKIYIVVNKNAYIEKILCIYKDECVEYYDVENKYIEGNEKVNNKINKKQQKLINNYMKLVSKKEQDNKICYINTTNEQDYKAFLTMCEEKRNISKKEINELLSQSESYFLLSSIIHIAVLDVVRLNNILPIVLVSSLLHNIFLIFNNHIIKPMDDSENKIKKLRLYLSYSLLVANIFVSSERISRDPKDFKRQVYNLGNVSQSVLLSFKQGITKMNVNNPFNYYEDINYDEFERLMMEAFNNNSYFKEKEIDVAYNLLDYLKDNPYINKARLYDKYTKTSIIYSNKKEDYAAAWVTTELNTITIFEKGLKDDETYHNTLLHELIHSTCNLSNLFINEGMTSILCEEYSWYEALDGYSRERATCKLLMELVGTNTMLEAYTTGNKEILVTALNEINPNERDNRKFIELLNIYEKQDYDKKFSDDNEEAIEICNMLLKYVDLADIEEDLKEDFRYFFVESFITNTDDEWPYVFFNAKEIPIEKVRY